jgi:hypothetical protein
VTAHQGDQRAEPAILAYAWWFVVGALAGVGLVGLLTIGLPCLLAAGVLAGIGRVWRPLKNHSATAIPAGASAAAWYLAWLNRGGPGEVCRPLGADDMECTTEWSPWPFVAVAMALIALSVVLAVQHRRRRPVEPAQP